MALSGRVATMTGEARPGTGETGVREHKARLKSEIFRLESTSTRLETEIRELEALVHTERQRVKRLKLAHGRRIGPSKIADVSCKQVVEMRTARVELREAVLAAVRAEAKCNVTKTRLETAVAKLEAMPKLFDRPSNFRVIEAEKQRLVNERAKIDAETAHAKQAAVIEREIRSLERQLANADTDLKRIETVGLSWRTKLAVNKARLGPVQALVDSLRHELLHAVRTEECTVDTLADALFDLGQPNGQEVITRSRAALLLHDVFATCDERISHHVTRGDFHGITATLCLAATTEAPVPAQATPSAE